VIVLTYFYSPFLPPVSCLKSCSEKLKHKVKISTHEFFTRCINFCPEIIRMTLYVFTRPFVHIYFTIYHIRGAHIYLVLLGCFNPFTVCFLPEQFTLNGGVFAAFKKKPCLSTFHTLVTALFLSFYRFSQVIAKESEDQN
jgi:hypothetical protein